MSCSIKQVHSYPLEFVSFNVLFLFVIRYILYKAPGEEIPDPQNPRIKTYKKEMKYLYVDSSHSVPMVPGTTNYKNLIEPSVSILPFNDQLCNCLLSAGVLMLEHNSFGVWLLHSTPQFPFRRDQNNFWPESGFKNAQIFICVTFNYDQFHYIGNKLKVDLNLTESESHSFVSRRLSSRAQRRNKMGTNCPSGDLYFTIAQETDSDVAVQTWGCQAGGVSSYCLDPKHKVYRVKNINTNTPVGSWMPSKDHSKWCVTKNQGKHWTCIGDVNRAETQYQRRGGALCINNEIIRNMTCSSPNNLLGPQGSGGSVGL
uniref:deoxyribonuclease II n=1 Tax=Amphilophus citrinellus TaxID=61819 RepID=A0A3Q0SX36_AMPCI